MSDNKQKILLVLSGNEYIRNYIQSGALDTLEQKFDCYYIGSERLSLREPLISKRNFLGYYPEDESKNARAFKHFNVLMYKHRHKSTSFVFRIKRTFYLPPYDFPLACKLLFAEALRLKFTLFRSYLSYYKNKGLVKTISSNLFFKFYNSNFQKASKVNLALTTAVKEIKPCMILFPSSAYDPIGSDIVKLCREHGIPSFFLIDNWDNLSSKSVLYDKPEYLGVWSQQSLEHAVEIQDFKSSRIFILGTPRYNHYFKTRSQDLPSYFDFKYILFVGTAVAFDEAGIIAEVDRLLEENPEIFKGIKLLYRPHPWRQGDDTIVGKNLRHVVIDPQLEDAYITRNATPSVQPDLNYYPSLIKNAEFVMGGLTSMLIETLVFRKSYMALAYNDGKYLTSQHNVWKYYVHFRGLENVNAINIIHDLNNFSERFISHWFNRNNIDIKEVDRQREYYLYQDENLEYKDKLTIAVKKILEEYAS